MYSKLGINSILVMLIAFTAYLSYTYDKGIVEVVVVMIHKYEFAYYNRQMIKGLYIQA